jgi:predicted solute-binding protein
MPPCTQAVQFWHIAFTFAGEYVSPSTQGSHVVSVLVEQNSETPSPSGQVEQVKHSERSVTLLKVLLYKQLAQTVSEVVVHDETNPYPRLQPEQVWQALLSSSRL